jgi:hypothetical protein
MARQNVAARRDRDGRKKTIMRRKANTGRPTAAEVKHSRAALWTIQLAVDAVADGLRCLGALQDQVYRSRCATMGTLQMARHHALKEADLRPIEDRVGQLARRLDWPRSLRARARYEHLERPLGCTESYVIGRWAECALALTMGMLDISEQLDIGYAGLVVSAATAARAAAARVTVEGHKRRAAMLMLRLDQLCADERVAWAFAAPGEDERSMPRRLLH